MTQSKKGGSPLIEDFMRMAEGAFGSVAGMRGELENMVRQQGERVLSSMEVPTREEVEVLKDLSAKVLARLEIIEKRLDALDKPKKSAFSLAKKPQKTKKSGN